MLVEVLLDTDLDKISFVSLDFTKKYRNHNNMTLLEYCYYHHHIHIIDFAYNTKLKNRYKNKEYM